MTKKILGSCHCNKIKIEINGPIYGFKHCHCKTCQKLSGTAFASNAIVDKSHFLIIEGKDDFHDYQTSSRKTVRYCKTCCSPIYSYMPKNPSEIYIRVGILDNNPEVRPEYHWWVSQNASWHKITDELPQYDTVPA